MEDRHDAFPAPDNAASRNGTPNACWKLAAATGWERATKIAHLLAKGLGVFLFFRGLKVGMGEGIALGRARCVAEANTQLTESWPLTLALVRPWRPRRAWPS